MAAVLSPRPPEMPSRTPTPPPSLSLNTTVSGSPAAVPNKHLPFCSPGPTPYGLPSPPASPPSNQSTPTSQSLLYPPDPTTRIASLSPPIYNINAATVALAIDQQSNRKLAKPHELFPWLHGLHPQNTLQQAFFTSRNPRKTSRRDACRPPFSQRFVTIVKVGGDLTSSRLKGALAPDELLAPLGSGSDLAPCFQDVDPRCGFSVRNFQIQACKLATVSDIVVYGDDSTPRDEVEKVAGLFAQAQSNLREEWLGDDIDASESDDGDLGLEEYNTFVVTDKFATFERDHPSMVALDSAGSHTGEVLDFLSQEREEMSDLSTASFIAENVALGSTPDPTLLDANTPNGEYAPEDPDYSIMIEASDLAYLPDRESLNEIANFLHEKARHGERAVANLEVPSSGSLLTNDRGDIDSRTLERLLMLCTWIYDQSHVSTPSFLPLTDTVHRDLDGDIFMTSSESLHFQPRRILLHCADGYTETTLVALAYYMFAHGVPLHIALLDLHVANDRNFFAYATDKSFLLAIESKLLSASPARVSTPTSSDEEENSRISSQMPPTLNDRPDWLTRMDGSLPSRVLPHLYLGNLQHAMNSDLIQALGITRVLSVGEPVNYVPDSAAAKAIEVIHILGVQDNGVDALRPEFERCLAFIDEAEQEVKETGGRRGKVLVHCRVGVSRSATIVIAAVMKKLNLSFPRAYCYVRARRLNVIVQPHLRFVYELLGWEDELGRAGGIGASDVESRGTLHSVNSTRQEKREIEQWQRNDETVTRTGDHDETDHPHCLSSTGRKQWKGRELEWATIAREIAAMNRPYCRQ
ncbi:MAG: hypothetical protein Q9162_000233 [Coniocarpon cinnabarinum]